MGKTVIGIIAGFIFWTVLWLGSDAVIVALAPDLSPGDDLSKLSTSYLTIKLVSSMIFSIIAGYAAALVSGENSRSPYYLGALLLLVGIAFQASAWNQIPLWYHAAFLLLLAPMAVAGGKFRNTRE